MNIDQGWHYISVHSRQVIERLRTTRMYFCITIAFTACLKKKELQLRTVYRQWTQCVFFLLPDKSQDTYINMFHHLVQPCSQIGIDLNIAVLHFWNNSSWSCAFDLPNVTKLFRKLWGCWSFCFWHFGSCYLSWKVTQLLCAKHLHWRPKLGQ